MFFICSCFRFVSECRYNILVIEYSVLSTQLFHHILKTVTFQINRRGINILARYGMLWVRTFIASSIYSSISGPVLNCRTISITSAASLAFFQRMDVFQFSPIRSATHALITLRKFSLNNIKIPIMEFLLFDNKNTLGLKDVLSL